MKLKFLFRTISSHDIKTSLNWSPRIRKRYAWGVSIDREDEYITPLTELYLLHKKRNGRTFDAYFLNNSRKL